MILFKKLIANDVGCQNTRKDAWLSFFSLVTPFLSRNKAKEHVINWFKDYSGSNHIWLYSSARNAFYVALKGLYLEKGDEIIIQPFSCGVIPEVIKELGLTPLLCDINSVDFSMNLDMVEKLITPKTKVLVLQHTYGISADITKARQLCTKYNLVLIEDCAHAIGATYEFMGKLFNVGSIGDAAFFSFGRDKAVSTATGGALVVNNLEITSWKENIVSFTNSLPSMSRWSVFQSLYYIIATKFCIRPLYYFLNIGKVVLFLSQKLSLVESVNSIQRFDSAKNPIAKYSDQLLPVLLNQLTHLEKTTQHRKQLYRRYALALGQDVPVFSNYMRFPLVLENNKISKENISNVYKELKYNLRFNQNTLCGTWYLSPFFPASSKENTHFESEYYPVLNTLIPDKVLNLPCNISMDRMDAETIISSVVSTLSPYQYSKQIQVLD
jgi:perosamine synthetase